MIALRCAMFAAGRASRIHRTFILHNSRRLKTKPRILEKEVPRIDERLFVDRSISKMVDLEFAFMKYQEMEPRVKVIDSYKDDEGVEDILHVSIKDFGDYVFKTNKTEQIIQLSSPKSGVWNYYYNQANERWQCSKDDHLVDELLLREILKYCNGGFNP